MAQLNAAALVGICLSYDLLAGKGQVPALGVYKKEREREERNP